MSSFVQIIPEDECIGDSLLRINSNFASLDTQLQILTQNYVVAHTCERNGIGSVNSILSFGDRATNHLGLKTLYNGQLIAASLQCSGIVGQFGVDAYLNGVSQTNYRLIYDSNDGPNGGQRTIFSTPLTFNAGDTLGWVQKSVPTAGVFVVNFLLKYIL